MSWVAVGTAAASLVGGAISGNQAKNAAKRQADDMARIQSMYNDLKAPSVEEQQAILERLAYEGDYSPEALEALGLGPSSMENVQADQQALDAQVDALNKMREISQGGLTEADEAAAREIQRKTDSSDMARRKSVLNEMAQRGVLGSGMELAAKLQGAQDSTQNQADANDKLIQQAQARALQALSQTGGLSEQMRYQSFNEGSQKAQAKDAINKFNLNNRQDISNQNIGNRNQAQLRNLGARQAVSNANTGLSNEEQLHNKALLQQDFDNQLNLTNAKANRASNTAAANYGVGQARAAQTGAILQGIGGALGAGLGAYNNAPANNAFVQNDIKKLVNSRDDIF
jgi:hypothetical protein